MAPQAGLFSAALTAFIIDSKQSLKVSPADQMVYYLQQNVAILDQISHQISSVVPQVSIPSTPPPPFPAFKPLASDIRVNVFWFMALIFSPSAALLAILVQQWVRDYMHVFQRYSDPLKSARLRQYLHEGSEGWYMPVMAEAVPGLLHVSLFLFFAGLVDFILNINTTVGITTAIPIGISGLLCIFTTFAPIIYPQSPYQNSFSGVIWYLIQKFGGGRRYKDRGSDGALKSVSCNMAEGQMQLAMEEAEDRKGRDERAVRWLVDNMTEDAEMESFVIAIPGSFNTEWGLEVWKKASNTIGDETSRNEPVVGTVAESNIPTSNPLVVQPPRLRTTWNIFDPIIRLVRTRVPSDYRADTMALLPASHVHPHPNTAAYTQGKDDMRELTTRIAHMLETFDNHSLSAGDELLRKRAHACIETTALLVCCLDAELQQFGDLIKLLEHIGWVEKLKKSPIAGKDQLFVTCWMCLSLIACRRPFQENPSLESDARLALEVLEGTDDHDAGDEQVLTTPSPRIIETFDKALRCLIELSQALDSDLNLGGDLTEERVKKFLRDHESHISELEHININVDVEDDSFRGVDEAISRVQSAVDDITHRIVIARLPGVESDDLDSSYDTDLEGISQFLELFRRPYASQFVFPVRNIKRICTLAPIFRDILEGRWSIHSEGFEMMLLDLEMFAWRSRDLLGNILGRQVWRLQDLRDGGGLGFAVELFFITFKELDRYSSKEPNSSLYIGTFRTVTSDWGKQKHSLGTQKLLLDMIIPVHGIISHFDYPAYIVNEFLVLLCNILEGQTGPHIDDAVQQLRHNPRLLRHRHRALFVKALGVITRTRVPPL